jgi:hypothetical protein
VPALTPQSTSSIDPKTVVGGSADNSQFLDKLTILQKDSEAMKK